MEESGAGVRRSGPAWEEARVGHRQGLAEPPRQICTRGYGRASGPGEEGGVQGTSKVPESWGHWGRGTEEHCRGVLRGPGQRRR